MGTGVLIGLAVASAAVGAVGSAQAASAQQKTADYNAAVQRNQAITARQNADAVRLSAKEDAKRQSRGGRKRQGTLRAGGASEELLADSAGQEKLEVLSMLHAGDIQALGYEARSVGFESGAKLSEMRGKDAKTAGFIGAAGTLIKGASTAAGFSSPSPTPNLSAAGGFNGSGGLLSL